MTESELNAICDRMQQYLLGKTQAISCKLGDDVVLEHTKILTTLQTNMVHILESVESINDKLDTQTNNHTVNSDKIQDVNNRVMKLEENKKSIITTICLIAVVAYEVGKEILFKKL